MRKWFSDLASMPGHLRRVFLRRADYRAVFEGPAGERVLADLAAFCHVHEPVHVPGDPYTTAFNDGGRRVVLRISAFLNMSDERLLQLAQQEAEANGEDIHED